MILNNISQSNISTSVEALGGSGRTHLFDSRLKVYKLYCHCTLCNCTDAGNTGIDTMI